MVSARQFVAEIFVGKLEMAEWVKAGSVDELKALFVEIPPVPKE